MPVPRSQQIDLDATPYYHCMARCVRHTFLCGIDHITGKDYSHRKDFLIRRMKKLTEIFSIDIAAYAVMENHYHLVLHVNKLESVNWTTDELKARWEALFPLDAEKLEKLIKNNAPENIIENKLKIWRERLASISWFMRCLNEPLAREANREDKVTGRFWEGRFKSQALLDEAAVLSAMVYTDLNPIRAGVRATPEESEFTSIYERIKAFSSHAKVKLAEKTEVETTSSENIAAICDKTRQPSFLLPIKPINHQDAENTEVSIDIKLSDYIDLVDFTGRHVREDKRGSIPDNLKPILKRIQLSDTGWFKMSCDIENNFIYAVGKLEKLEAFNKANRQRMLRGTHAAKACYLKVLE